MSLAEILIPVIIGGIFAIITSWFALREYDKQLRNQQIFHAKQLIFNRKDEAFNTYIIYIGTLSYIKSVRYRMKQTIDQVTADKKTPVEGIEALLIEIKDMDLVLGRQIISEELNQLYKSILTYRDKKVTPNEFIKYSTEIYECIDIVYKECNYKLPIALTQLELYITDPKILSELWAYLKYIAFTKEEELEVLYPSNQQRYNLVVNLMREELKQTIESLKY